MRASKLSRRQILSGLLGGLFAWLWPGKTKAAAPLPTPAASGVPVPPPFFGVTTYSYDADGNCTTVEYGFPCPAKASSTVHDSLGRITTFYDANG